tara:strand:+ start:9944 stop:10903 length:960 start_codon:yes stop_codon:yes gene_type:complete
MNFSQKISAYKTCYEIRELELNISKKYAEGRMRCPTHLSIGQEGVPSALSLLMKKKDFVISSHRPHAHYISKGGNIDRMLSEIYGKENGCSKGRGGSMHLIDLNVNFMGSTAIVGNSIPVGVGLALSSKIKNENRITYIFLGDAVIETGVFWESLNFSIIKNLPIIFICENNFFSVYSPLKVRQPKNRKIHSMVKAAGINSFSGDGNIIEEVFEITNKAIKNIKKGLGPQFLEFKTYRWLEHCGPNFDDSLNYRPKELTDRWIKKDPLRIIKKKIGKKNFSLLKKINNQIDKKINKSFYKAENSKFPNAKDFAKYVYKK